MKELECISSEVQKLIAAYLSGSIQSDEMQHLICWIQSSESNKRLFNQMNDIWQATASEKKFSKTDVQKHWEEVLKKIQKKPSRKTNQYVYMPPLYTQIKRVLGIAAVIAVIFGAGMLVQNMRSVPEKNFSETVEYIEVTAPAGSRAHIVLADGSKIWLNAGTKLQYSNQFGKRDRNIKLTGEAYFSVAKRADLPFVIKAADIVITALGTVFNVKAYAEEGYVETSLESGSVKIERIMETSDGKENWQRPIVLQSNEKVSLVAYAQPIEETGKEEKTVPEKQEIAQFDQNHVAEPVIEKLEDIRVSTSWKDSNWVIRDESMKSLAVKLGRRYDVNFVFRDKELEKYKFSTTLRDETLEQVLNMIQMAAPIKYMVKEKNVYLSLNPKFMKTFEESIQ